MVSPIAFLSLTSTRLECPRDPSTWWFCSQILLLQTADLVPTSWNAGSKTGFVPTSPSTAQRGFLNQVGTSTAQMEGDTVGAYINSKDLPTTLTNQLMMISPEYIFPSGVTPVPFGIPPRC